jgi:16S rRNA (cytidine1402-2'-O)-methyltransferase
VFGRELTKLFEQIARMPLSDALEWIKADPNRQRGEFVILVGPAAQAEGIPPDAERVLKLLLAELPLKSAAKLAAEITGVAKNALYEYALTLKK